MDYIDYIDYILNIDLSRSIHYRTMPVVIRVRVDDHSARLTALADRDCSKTGRLCRNCDH